MGRKRRREKRLKKLAGLDARQDEADTDAQLEREYEQFENAFDGKPDDDRQGES